MNPFLLAALLLIATAALLITGRALYLFWDDALNPRKHFHLSYKLAWARAWKHSSRWWLWKLTGI